MLDSKGLRRGLDFLHLKAVTKAEEMASGEMLAAQAEGPQFRSTALALKSWAWQCTQAVPARGGRDKRIPWLTSQPLR